MTIDEIKSIIDTQIGNIQYLREHQAIAKRTIMRETKEYCRGALDMLNFLKDYIELNNNNEGR